MIAMDKNENYPYCDFWKYHDANFNGGSCPCGDSFMLDGELRCIRTPDRIKKYRAEGYYFKCECMRVKKQFEQISLF